MHIDQLDAAIAIRNHRQKAINLRERTHDSFFECNLNRVEVASIISLLPVRDFIRAELDRRIARYDEQLKEMGIEI